MITKHEFEYEGDKMEMDFKGLVFANNPRLYRELWETPTDDEEVEWIEPESPEEVEELLKHLRD